jgi:hypothetical protein
VFVKEMRTSNNEPSYSEFEALFVNNDSLQRIEAHLNRFNPIRVMKMEGMEIRHSAILSWLLDPSETHQLGDHFLRAFLAEALKGRVHERPNALQISQSDMRDAEVRCEWNNIDIFVLSPQNRWAFIVENKVHSVQHSGQLMRYRNRVLELFRAQSSNPETDDSVELTGIFLTLNYEEPEDSNYLTIRYAQILKLLRNYVLREEYVLSSEVAVFLSHYIEVLEELTGMSKERTEMENIARQLYREHKKVLDFIVEHGAGSDFALAVRRVFGENPARGDIIKIGRRDFVYSGLAKRFVGFLPASWREELDKLRETWPGCEKWWLNYPLMTWIEMAEAADGKSGSLKLVAEVGPVSDHQFRKSMIEAITIAAEKHRHARIQFQSGAADNGRSFARFLRQNNVNIGDIHNVDEIENKLLQILNGFEDEFAIIDSIIPHLS